MSGIMSVDHHADFAGWAGKKKETTTENRSWSSRQKAVCLLVCSVASWFFVIGPFVLLG